MRTTIIITALCFLCLFSHAQNVGIGTTTPVVKLHVLKGFQTVAPSFYSTMAVQSDGETFLQILSNAPEDQNGIVFGNTGQPLSAGITFNFSGNRELAFFTNGSAPSFVLNNQGKVGIGTLSPIARLHIADSNVVFTGPATIPVSTIYDPPIQGPGTRMMWYPQKAAFRVGNVNGTQWDKNNIGTNSFASGANTKASGDYSNAMGVSTTASGFSSNASGTGTIASGSYSFAMGGATTASGFASTSTGSATTASGDYSTAMGYFSSARSYCETAIGTLNTDYIPISSTSWNTSDRLFVIGNGTISGTKSDAIVVLKNGNTGIGTSTPHAQLQLATTLANRKIVLYEVADNDNQFQGFGMNFGVLRYQVNQTGDAHVFYAGTSATTSNELMRINGNGNVGIGTASPDYKLHIGVSNSGLRVEGPALSASGGAALSIGGNGELQIDKPGTVGGRFIIKENGNVGIDKNNPGYKLDVTGDINASGNVRANGVILSSDARFKQNISTIPNALTNLLQLRGTNYFFNTLAFPERNFSTDKQMGVIAQEVEKVFPELVSTDKQGYKSVNYIGLIPVLLEGMKEQQQQIDELKQLVKTLMNK